MSPPAPESAPRCPRCGYLLHGLPRLRCPECGIVLESDEDVSKARWLADDNRANRQAVLAERLAVILGIALMAAGMTMGVCHAVGQTFVNAYLALERVVIPILATGGYVWYRVRIQEPLLLPLLLMGIGWFFYGLILLFLFS